MADKVLTLQKNISGNRHIVAKEIQGGGGGDPCPIQVDDFNTVTLEEGKLYFLTQDCVVEYTNYVKGYYTYNNNKIERFDVEFVDIGEVPINEQFSLQWEDVKKLSDNPDAWVTATIEDEYELLYFKRASSSIAMVYECGGSYRLTIVALSESNIKGTITHIGFEHLDEDLQVSNGTLKHSNDKITAGTFSAGTITDTSGSSSDGGQVKFRKQSFDAFGHQVSQVSDDAVLTIGGGLQISGGTLKHTNSISEGSIPITFGTNTVDFGGVNFDPHGHITGVSPSNGRTITFTGGLKSGTTGIVEHTNNITAGSGGVNVYNNVLEFIDLLYDSQGHIKERKTGKQITFQSGLKMGTNGIVEHTNSVSQNRTLGLKLFTHDAQGHINGSNDVDIGGGLTLNSGTLKHSNSITAQATQKAGKVSFDAHGHMTGFTEEHYVKNYMSMGTNQTRALLASKVSENNESYMGWCEFTAAESPNGTLNSFGVVVNCPIKATPYISITAIDFTTGDTFVSVATSATWSAWRKCIEEKVLTGQTRATLFTDAKKGITEYSSVTFNSTSETPGGVPINTTFTVTVGLNTGGTFGTAVAKHQGTGATYICTKTTSGTTSSYTAWNKVLQGTDIATSITSSSTNTQVASAKSVWDFISVVPITVSFTDETEFTIANNTSCKIKLGSKWLYILSFSMMTHKAVSPGSVGVTGGFVPAYYVTNGKFNFGDTSMKNGHKPLVASESRGVTPVYGVDIWGAYSNCPCRIGCPNGLQADNTEIPCFGAWVQ